MLMKKVRHLEYENEKNQEIVQTDGNLVMSREK